MCLFALHLVSFISNVYRQDSVAGSVNQATGLPDFEDVLRTGARVGQDFQPACVCTNPEATVAGTSDQSWPKERCGALWANSNLNPKLDYIYNIDIFRILSMRRFQNRKKFSNRMVDSFF